MQRLTLVISFASFVLSAGIYAQGPLPGEQRHDTTADDQKTLKGVGLAVDGPSMLDYFRKRTFKEANPKEMERLIQQLGDADFATREKAYAGLISLGPSALVGLKQADAHADVEVKQRARDLRERLEAKAEPAIQAATARLIAREKPMGAAEVLLGFLPFAPDLAVTDELCKTLGSVAVQGGKIDPVVTQALGDKIGLKRGAAAEALVRADVAKQLPEPDKHLPLVRSLLKDPEPTVRLRAGLALITRKEKEALPVLVELLNHLSPEQVWPVEEILIRLAGDKVPEVSLGTTEETRKACFTAWNKWLLDNPKLTLAKLDEVSPMLGRTVIVQQKARIAGVGGRVPGEVVELDKERKPIWKFDVQNYPVDAHVYEDDKGETRVLVAEFQGSQVSIRDTKGNALKEFRVGGNPIGVQRLPSGNIFVVLQNRLVELDMNGAEKFSYNRPNHDIFRAKKLPNGEVAFVTSGGAYSRISAATQQVQKSFQVASVPVLFGSMDVLPNGNVLVPDFQQNRVVEYNGEGKQVAQFNVQWPNSAMRLSDGNTLVASQNTKKVMEFNRGGTIVWQYDSDGMVFNAKRR
jgi:hypothetical protein